MMSLYLLSLLGFRLCTRLRAPDHPPEASEKSEVFHLSEDIIEFVCIFFYILSTRPSISLLICSGSSVFELCPAPLIHSILIPDLLCHFLLYLIHEPA